MTNVNIRNSLKNRGGGSLNRRDQENAHHTINEDRKQRSQKGKEAQGLQAILSSNVEITEGDDNITGPGGGGGQPENA